MSADQAVLDRIHRIESGKTWAPEGVLHEKRQACRRKCVNAGQKRVSFVLSLVLVWGLVWVFAEVQPELYGQITTGDFSSVIGMLESLPVDRLPLPETLSDA